MTCRYLSRVDTVLHVLNTNRPLLMLNRIPLPSCYPQHTMMFPKFLVGQFRGPFLGLLVALSVSVLLNLGVLFYSLSIITRGTQEYCT